MMFYTHMIFSAFLYFLYLAVNGIPFVFSFNQIFNLLIMLIFSLLSDIDSNNSKYGRKFFFSFLFKHRGILHSLFPLIVLYFINFYAFLGYFSHLFLDSLTKKGIKPFNSKFKIKWIVRTNSILEKTLSFITFLGLIYVISI